MIAQISSPYLNAPLATPPPPACVEAAPQDVVTRTSDAEAPVTMSVGKRAGVALLAGVALAGVLAPTAANARPMRAEFSQARVVPTYYRGGGGGNAFAWGLFGGMVGGMIGGAIANGGVYVPYPAYPVYPAPPPVVYGYNGVGCDGVYHHFDAYGNVADQSGHYRLIQDGYGACYRTNPSY